MVWFSTKNRLSSWTLFDLLPYLLTSKHRLIGFHAMLMWTAVLTALISGCKDQRPSTGGMTESQVRLLVSQMTTDRVGSGSTVGPHPVAANTSIQDERLTRLLHCLVVRPNRNVSGYSGNPAEWRMGQTVAPSGMCGPNRRVVAKEEYDRIQDCFASALLETPQIHEPQLNAPISENGSERGSSAHPPLTGATDAGQTPGDGRARPRRRRGDGGASPSRRHLR